MVGYSEVTAQKRDREGQLLVRPAWLALIGLSPIVFFIRPGRWSAGRTGSCSLCAATSWGSAGVPTRRS